MAEECSNKNFQRQALAEPEARWPGRVPVMTQNIDGIRKRAGTRNLIHMQGELLKACRGNCGAWLFQPAFPVRVALAPRPGRPPSLLASEARYTARRNRFMLPKG